MTMPGCGNFQKGTIFVMDRGYEGYGIAGAIHFKGMSYVIRAKDGTDGRIARGPGLPRTGEYDITFTRAFTFRHNADVSP